MDDPESRSFLEDRHPMGRLGQPAEIAVAALLPCWWPPQPRGCMPDGTVTK